MTERVHDLMGSDVTDCDFCMAIQMRDWQSIDDDPDLKCTCATDQEREDQLPDIDPTSPDWIDGYQTAEIEYQLGHGSLHDELGMERAQAKLTEADLAAERERAERLRQGIVSAFHALNMPDVGDSVARVRARNKLRPLLGREGER